jgi:hypothetical protein
MCGATSEDEARVIEKDRDPQEDAMFTDEFIAAEIEFRRARALKERSAAHDRGHRVPRRVTLRLPRPRRRPVSLA